MKGLIFVIAILSMLAVGCEKSKPTLPVTARSNDGRLLYALDAEQQLLVAFDAKNAKRIAEVPVGRAPESVTVGSDDKIYVANRGSRSVSVVAKNSWDVVRTVRVGPEPVAVAVSSDNATLYVLNNTSFESPDEGTLSAISLKTRRPRWVLNVGRNPRQLQILEGAQAEVIAGEDAPTIRVDLARGQLLTPVARAPVGNVEPSEPSFLTPTFAATF